MSRAASALVVICIFTAPIHAREDALPATATLSEWAKKSEGRYAYAMYIKGHKVGWTIEEMKLGKHDGKDVVKSTSESYSSTIFDGDKSVKEEKTVITYELTGDGAIIHAAVKKKEDGKEITRTVVRKGKGLHMTTKQGGRTIQRTIEMPRDTLAHQRKLEEWLQGKIEPGDKFTKYSATWDEEDVNQKEIWSFKEKKAITLGGVKETAFVVEVDVDGGKMKAEVLKDGRLISGTLGGLLSLRLEKESIVKKMGDKEVDLLAASAIIINRDLGRARDVDALTLEVTGLDDFKIPASHRQLSKEGKEATTLKILRDSRVENAHPLTKEQKGRYTRTTPRLQCDHEAVIEHAKKIIGDEKDPLKRAKLMEAWVHKTLKKSYKDNADTALEVLDHKAGDCTEHSLLFVALARAVGVPAREVGGIAYTRTEGKAGKPLFAWHAWAEIHDGHQWVTVDPTWHQVYVDGTHIKLSEGSRDLAWANVAGKMKIKVVAVKKKGKKE